MLHVPADNHCRLHAWIGSEGEQTSGNAAFTVLYTGLAEKLVNEGEVC